MIYFKAFLCPPNEKSSFAMETFSLEFEHRISLSRISYPVSQQYPRIDPRRHLKPGVYYVGSKTSQLRPRKGRLHMPVTFFSGRHVLSLAQEAGPCWASFSVTTFYFPTLSDGKEKVRHVQPPVLWEKVSGTRWGGGGVRPTWVTTTGAGAHQLGATIACILSSL